ncbi:uncharacterized protein PODANS_6_4250 [Podospora anserina S mat+]|uniref:Podospora anserina S mat+ genomic DNA chromosome 6, supercontig 2 n=1 Tax=Podospora anserina (strain S / ATCC MYA-4624 / DSM 980 / FGSC 10383) TaxID=515849 RepID=B2B1S0_PODAN|nr:uncharacterized protein PODANS_6_4250 [Podospora anserina S mat+]CAP71055.1 unnamed protein product [Podospora anserina S mat+]CDP30455.1 Putative Protein similar to C1F7.11c of Schizosaccharomyces pombe [Podospora anserina S mat+]
MSTLSPGDAGAWPAAANGASSEYPDAGLNNDTAAAEDNAPARPPPRKRRRIVISCTECHRRKQKCDRQLPCTNCISRNKHSACHYETGAPTARQQQRRQQLIVPTSGTADGADGGGGASNSGSGSGSTTTATSPDMGKSPITSSSSTTTHHTGSDLSEHIATNGGKPVTKVASETFGYSGAGTLGFLRKIEESTTGDENLPPPPGQHTSIDQTTPSISDGLTREKYKSLIRQLPARVHIEKLVDIYFREFNWQYYALDRTLFDSLLAQWYTLPFSILSQGGPSQIPLSLRPFPGLLFNIIAIALLTLSSDDREFEGLLYAGLNMTFEDLANDYSDSGLQVLQVLGKRSMTLTTVLAGFARASFLKYVGLVTESWHAIGSAIRDAQEIGLHRDSLDPRPPSGATLQEVLEVQWEVQRRRKIWMTLVVWDVHMAGVLGRPTTINLTAVPPSLPVDVKGDSPVASPSGELMPIVERGENEPPTPLTRAVWAYHLMAPMREILELEKEGPCPRDFARVDKLHEEVVSIEKKTPPFFRLENPDTRFDDREDCYWLPLARAKESDGGAQGEFGDVECAEVALHGAEAGFVQDVGHPLLPRLLLPFLTQPRFALFFGTFDAIVLMAAIYILFPREHPELVQSALQHFQWAVERFEAMSERNALAKAALGVLHAVRLRLRRSLDSVANKSQSASSGTSPSTTTTVTSKANPLSQSSSSTGTNAAASSGGGHHWETHTPRRASRSSSSTGAGSAISPNPLQVPLGPLDFSQPGSSTSVTPTTDRNFYSGGQVDWTLPSDFNWASLQPIYPTHDLIFNDLVGVGDTNGNGLSWDTRTTVPGLGGLTTVVGGREQVQQPPQQQQQQQQQQGVQGQGQQAGVNWQQFEGDFGNDSVWSLLNQFGPM